MHIRTEGLSWQRLDDSVVVLDLEGSSYLRLNDTGSVLWETLLEGAGRSDLVARLVGRYGIEEDTAVRDVDAFLADLREYGLLVEP